MFPSRFDYMAPRSIEEVLATLDRLGEDAKLLAGGQSLIPLMKLRFGAPSVIVDLNRVPGLSFIDEEGDRLRVGAMTRHCELAASELISTRYPAMATAAPLISDPLIRNLGTIGGSLAHADPAGDWGSVMLALGAEVVARSSKDSRTIPMSELFLGPFTTVLAPNEVVTEVRIPRPAGPAGGTYLKLERKVGDFATVGVAAQLELGNGTIARAGIGLTAVGPENLRASPAEELLAGSEPTREIFEEAGVLAAGACDPISDVRGPAEYKRDVVRVFVRRGLNRALELARNGG
jgi:aerobic carbon-monoxide dehydrogenase medium subunit